MKVTDRINITNEDCMDLLRRTPDNYYSLALVDPPYGIGYSGRDGQKTIKYDNSKQWDKETPTQEYFDELFRVSKNQIIWGANYFTEYFNLGKGIICWFKHQNGNFSEWELAYTSQGNAKFFDRSYQQDQYNKIHPTQKPVALYKWLLDKYAKPNDKILDTHLGSGSIAIACHDYGFELTGCELDEDYFNKGIERITNHVSQQKLF
jgi:site-specific DNA-methyltransferase (adenine-specific)